MNVVPDGPFEHGSLTDSAHAHEYFDRFPRFREALAWMNEFVLQPDTRLSRPGAVCPRLAPTVRRNLLWLGSIKALSFETEDAVRLGREMIPWFGEFFATNEAFRAGSLLAVFSDVPMDKGAQFIDQGHRRLRPHFVRAGLMLGEFHPHSTVGSVRNPDFPVMRSPVPMFAVRALTVHDLMFLDTEQTPAVQRREYLELYLKYVGDEISEKARARVTGRIRETEEQLRLAARS